MLSPLWWVFGPMGQKVHRAPFTGNIQTYYKYTETIKFNKIYFVISIFNFSNLYFIYMIIEIFFTFSEYYNWRMKNKKITHICILRHIHLPYNSYVRGIYEKYGMLMRVENTCAFYARFYPFEKNGRGFLMQRSTHI